jgi:DNA-binding beta-propeller fold protein YncE
VTNGAGTLFVNIEDKSEIVVIDLKSQQVLHHWALSPGEAPTGLAIDNTTHRLFSTCSDSKQLMILDAGSGAVISKIPIGAGCDGVAFDEVAKCIYTSNGEGNITVVKQGEKDSYSTTGTIPTKKGARTIALDVATHKLYLPAKDNNAFQVLVFGR